MTREIIFKIAYTTNYWIYLRALCFLLHMCVHPTVLFSLISHVSSCVLEFVYSKFVLVFLQESLKPDLLISNLNRTNSSSGDLNRVSYNDLCFPKISNYGSMKKKKHNVGVECRLNDNTKMNGWKPMMQNPKWKSMPKLYYHKPTN